jgi:hypothetical protein
VSLNAPRGERQHRIESIQRLNGGVVIDAKHRGMGRRIQVQADAALASKSGSLEVM